MGDVECCDGGEVGGGDGGGGGVGGGDGDGDGDGDGVILERQNKSIIS